MTVLIDMHAHLHEYSDSEIESMLEADGRLVIVAVSDDLRSAWRTIELWERYPDRIVPCIGFHPWNVKEGKVWEAWEVLRLAERFGPPCIGEVGLDKRFVDEYTWRVQNAVFDSFLNLAEETAAMVNVHSPSAWKHVAWRLSSLEDARIMYHWYTGPVTLARAIEGYKTFFSINSALRIQEKSVKVATALPLDYIVVESDGPYEYRGLKLSPLMIPGTLKLLAEIKGLPLDDVVDAVARNSQRIIGSTF